MQDKYTSESFSIGDIQVCRVSVLLRWAIFKRGKNARLKRASVDGKLQQNERKFFFGLCVGKVVKLQKCRVEVV